MRYKDKQFDVEFAPDVSRKTLIDAIQGVRKSFKASLARPISVKASQSNLTIEASTDKNSYKNGSSGKIRILLHPKSDAKGVTLTATADSAVSMSKKEKKLTGKLKKNESVVLPFKLTNKASPGLHKVTVVVRYQGQIIKVVVPVYSN